MGLQLQINPFLERPLSDVVCYICYSSSSCSAAYGRAVSALYFLCQCVVADLADSVMALVTALLIT